MRAWTWLEAILLPFTLAVMLTTWVYSGLHLFALLNYDGEDILAPLSIGLLWLSALFLTRWSLNRQWRARLGQAFIVGAGLAAIIVVVWSRLPVYRQYADHSVPPLYLAIPVCVWLWWRGIVAGRESFHYQRVYQAFVVGVVCWVVILILGYLTLGAQASTYVAALLLFVFTALVALAIGSLATAQKAERQKTGVSLAVNRYWLALTGAVIAVIVLLGLLIAALVTPELVASFLQVVEPLLNLFAQLLYLVIVVFAYVAFLIITPLINFIRNLPHDSSIEQQPQMPDLLRQLGETAGGQTPIPEWVSTVSHALLIIVALATVVALFALAFRKFYSSQEEGIDEDREFIGSWDLLKGQLTDLLRRLGARGQGQDAVGPRFLPLEGQDGRRAIRELYQKLLSTTSEAGHARLPGQTPAEYSRVLAQWTPDIAEPLEELTSAYVEARYGQGEVPEEQIGRARQAWENLREPLVRRTGRNE